MSKPAINNEKSLSNSVAPPSEAVPPNTPLSTQTNNQLLPPSQFITHHPKSGLNPLVDAAAYLFSIIGKLKQTKSYRHLKKLHKELVQEINIFQDSAKAQGYSSEYILVSRYALSATLDDIISNTSWGNQGHWDNYSVLAAFNQEATHQERFFMILERIVKDPAHYIDVMELMYICLSLGFKGSYRSTEFSNNQLEQITHTLYKHIRAFQGDFSKTLSPFPIKPAPTLKPVMKSMSIWLIPLITLLVIIVLFISLGFMLDTISNQAYQELMHIGKTHESHK